ncbi:MAG: hypothetical protein CO167_12395, partial [Candidatus Marinimicrobia bacterium CG_4_9_14_3_um_filter_48_9]
MMQAIRLKTGFIPVFFVLLLITTSLQAKLQVKGLWVVRGTLTTPARVDQMIRFAISGGYTDIFVQVRGRGDAFYESKMVPKSSLIRPRTFDPLADIIHQAHGAGIRVHAWFNTYLAWSASSLPS